MRGLNIPDIDLKKELSKCDSMEEHLGRDKYVRNDTEDKNYRNGYSSKNIKTSFGEVAINALQTLEATWSDKYPIVIQSWNNNWENLYTYFDFPPEIRRIIYTTNALEGFNRQLRKFTKIRTSFPTDDSLRKALYLATEQIMTKWTSPCQN